MCNDGVALDATFVEGYQLKQDARTADHRRQAQERAADLAADRLAEDSYYLVKHLGVWCTKRAGSDRFHAKQAPKNYVTRRRI